MLDGESLAFNWSDKNNLTEMLPNMKASVAAYETYRSTAEFQMT